MTSVYTLASHHITWYFIHVMRKLSSLWELVSQKVDFDWLSNIYHGYTHPVVRRGGYGVVYHDSQSKFIVELTCTVITQLK